MRASTPRRRPGSAADAVATAIGSWRFIIIQSAIVAAWIILNLVAALRHFDPYPFILLNLLFSTQAAYAAPIIMMSQNRQAVTVGATAEIVGLAHANTVEIRRLAQQTELLTLLRGHAASSEEARGFRSDIAVARGHLVCPAARFASDRGEHGRFFAERDAPHFYALCAPARRSNEKQQQRRMPRC